MHPRSLFREVQGDFALCDSRPIQLKTSLTSQLLWFSTAVSLQGGLTFPDEDKVVCLEYWCPMRRVADGRLFVAFITCSPHLSYTHIPIAMATVPALCGLQQSSVQGTQKWSLWKWWVNILLLVTAGARINVYNDGTGMLPVQRSASPGAPPWPARRCWSCRASLLHFCPPHFLHEPKG